MTFTGMLSESISEVSALAAARTKKRQQRRDFKRASEIKTTDGDQRMSDAIFTNVRGGWTWRIAQMRGSTISPTKSIMDRDVAEWPTGPCTNDGSGSPVPTARPYAGSNLNPLLNLFFISYVFGFDSTTFSVKRSWNKLYMVISKHFEMYAS